MVTYDLCHARCHIYIHTYWYENCISDDNNCILLRNDSWFFPIKPSLVDDLTTFIKARLAKTRPYLQDPLVLYVLECVTLRAAASGPWFVTCL